MMRRGAPRRAELSHVDGAAKRPRRGQQHAVEPRRRLRVAARVPVAGVLGVVAHDDRLERERRCEDGAKHMSCCHHAICTLRSACAESEKTRSCWPRGWCASAQKTAASSARLASGAAGAASKPPWKFDG